MFCLNIALGSTSWRLLFEHEENAQAAFKKSISVDPIFDLKDDFGQHLVTKASAVHGVMFEDLNKTKMAHVEIALHQERTRVLATKMAQTDPALRAASAGAGPAIMTPFAGGNGRSPF